MWLQTGIGPMRVAAPVDAEHLARLRLMRPAIARMVAALRAGVGVAAVTSGLLAGGKPLSWWILAPTLAVVAGWTALYVRVAWTRGLPDWLVGTDLLLTALFCLTITPLMPASARAAGARTRGEPGPRDARRGPAARRQADPVAATLPGGCGHHVRRLAARAQPRRR